MRLQGSNLIITILVALFFIIVIEFQFSLLEKGYQQGSKEFCEYAGLSRRSKKWSSSVNELQVGDLPLAKPYQCVRQFLGDKNWIMCAKGPEEYISGIIYSSGIWDLGISTLIAEMTGKYPGGLFLDIGANMGAFSVQIAADKYRVMAVDPTPYNLALIRKSTELAGTEEFVRLIQNPVSDEKITLIPWTQGNPSNEGGLVFLTEEEAKTKPAADVMGKGVESIKFEELLEIIDEETIIIKIDVEGAECKVLSHYLNSVEPKRKFIPYIFMEWVHVANNPNGLCPDVNKLIEGFFLSGYRPVNFPVGGTTAEELTIDSHQGWLDMLWVHRDAKM